MGIGFTGGVDWGSKTPVIQLSTGRSSTNNQLTSVSGSGYITGINVSAGDKGDEFKIEIDGNTIYDNDLEFATAVNTGASNEQSVYAVINGLHRFDNGFTTYTGSVVTTEVTVGVQYVLD